MPLWGIDLGGTKIEGVILESKSNPKVIVRERISTEAEKGYQHIISQIVRLVEILSQKTGLTPATIGIGTPGSIDPRTGKMKNSNSTALNGQPLFEDVSKALKCEIKMANDANCFALAETKMGVIREEYPEAQVVFGVIMGTGVGAGYVVDKQLVVGPNKLTGEWGQNPIPGPMDDYEKSMKRHCGRIGAIEVFLSGPGLENWFEYTSGIKKNSREVVNLFKNGDKVAVKVMKKYFERTARAFSTFVNILDPDIIVCGGGMSEIDEIYSELPQLIIPYIASDIFLTPVTKAEHGASSGVRGAAHLW